LLRFLQEKKLMLPVIILTGQGDELIASKMIRHGALDYLSKSNLNRKSLINSINFAFDKHYLKRDKERAMVVMGELSTKDKLTGLYNRRYFDDVLEREIAGARRYHTTMALILMDLDHFKNVNDTYGHTAGDYVLETISKIIKSTLRDCDIPCRYGGEEISIILPNTDKEGVKTVCDRIRVTVAEYPFEFETFVFHVTLSAGISFVDQKTPEQGFNLPDQLIKKADAALYQAKKNGRNKIVFA
jgi:two-component system cell cycle response regulator